MSTRRYTLAGIQLSCLGVELSIDASRVEGELRMMPFPIHPTWFAMMMVGWNIYLSTVTPSVFHPFIDEMQRKSLDAYTGV
jgi:hypothetical protein